MNKRETVQALMDSIQKGDFADVELMLADDFRFNSPSLEPIKRDAWIEMSIHLKTAFPDLNYHFKVIGAQGDVVRSTMQLSGTHSGALDLANVGMGVIPATKKAFYTKPEKIKVTIRENKISAWVIEPTDGTGLQAILRQLGIDSIPVIAPAS